MQVFPRRLTILSQDTGQVMLLVNMAVVLVSKYGLKR